MGLLRAVALAVLTAAAVVAGGCGGDGGSDRGATAGQDRIGGPPAAITVPGEPGHRAGRRVLARSGCLACHRIGTDGNDGPGPDLARVGARLDPPALERALEAGPGIMPSYESLERERPRDFRELIGFLSSLGTGSS